MSAFSVTREITINLGNYESTRVGVTVHGDDLDALTARADSYLFARARRVLSRGGKLPPLDSEIAARYGLEEDALS